MNVIARLEFELTCYDFTDHRFNHYTTRTPPIWTWVARSISNNDNHYTINIFNFNLLHHFSSSFPPSELNRNFLKCIHTHTHTHIHTHTCTHTHTHTHTHIHTHTCTHTHTHTHIHTHTCTHTHAHTHIHTHTCTYI